MTAKEKLEWIHFAIQEAMNDNPGELEQAIGLVEDLREKTSDKTSLTRSLKYLKARGYKIISPVLWEAIETSEVIGLPLLLHNLNTTDKESK
jgi:hypothetical protein